MAVKEKIMAFPFRIGQDLYLVIDLGATGKVKGDIALIEKSINASALAAIVSASYSLAELGRNLYALGLTGAAVSAANAGANHLVLSGATINRCHVDFFLTTQAKDVYDDLSSKTLQVGLQANVVNSTSIQDNALTAAKINNAAITGDKIAASAVSSAKIASNALTAAKFATDSITADALQQAAADEIATRTWLSGTRELTGLGSSAIQSIWHYLTSNITLAGSIGKLIKDNLDAKITALQSLINAIKAQTDQFVFGTSGVNSEPKTPLSITTADKDDIVDKMCDEALSGHDAGDTVGRALNDIRAYVSGRRKIINAGANEELYDKSDVLRYTFTLTKEAGTDNYVERTV